MAWEKILDKRITDNKYVNFVDFTVNNPSAGSGKADSFGAIIEYYGASSGTGFFGSAFEPYNKLSAFEFNTYRYKLSNSINSREFVFESLSELKALNDKRFIEGYSNTFANIIIYREPKILPNGKLKDQAPGTVINFADSLWTILEPTLGYLRKNESIGAMPFHSSRNGNIYFDPTQNDNLAQYLNTTFYETLSDKAKASILTKNWGIEGTTNGEHGINTGTQITPFTLAELKKKEDSKLVSAKVGLLSASEWRRYAKGYIGKNKPGDESLGIIDNPQSNTWLRSNTSTIEEAVWTIMTNGFLGQSGTKMSREVHPTLYIDPNTNIENGTVVHNAAPTITVNTPNNETLYENDTFLVDGNAKDTDKNDIVNVYYQINSSTARPIQTRISDGVSPIPFSEQLTFKGGKLYLPDGTAFTGALAEGIAHKLKVWAEDNKGGKSEVVERTFYVVPNRAPKLTINPFDTQSDLINADKVTFTGTTSDPDGNDTVVSYRLNNGLATEVYRGKDGDWSFDLLLKVLKDGENTVVVETVDSYNFKTSLTRKINKQANLTPLSQSVQRYTIVPPAGSAQGVLMWIERDATQNITAEISMTNGTEQEQFKPMTLDSSGPANVGTVEDFFKFRANAPAEKIAIKLSWIGDKPIFKVSGALTQ